MQVVLLVPEADWLALVAEVEQLKQTVAQLAPRPHSQRARSRALPAVDTGRRRKARRQGRLIGLHLNEKEWGFRQSELDRYLTRYNRCPITGSE